MPMRVKKLAAWRWARIYSRRRKSPLILPRRGTSIEAPRQPSGVKRERHQGAAKLGPFKHDDSGPTLRQQRRQLPPVRHANSHYPPNTAAGQKTRGKNLNDLGYTLLVRLFKPLWTGVKDVINPADYNDDASPHHIRNAVHEKYSDASSSSVFTNVLRCCEETRASMQRPGGSDCIY